MKRNPTPEKYISCHREQNKIMMDSIYIIMANDDSSNRQFFKQAFEGLDIAISVDILHTGEQLMSFLSKSQVKLPHLILLNLNAPFLNGITFLKEIKCIEKLESVTIGIYSNTDSQKEENELFLHGANICIHKKDTLTELSKALHKIITATFVYKNPPFNINNFVMTV